MSENEKTQISQIEQKLKALKIEKEKLLRDAAAIDGEYLSSYEIRPAGRHVLTIGEELIQDQFAAIVELVKNCYDADSADAIICFRRLPERNWLEIRIEDHGHGMSTDDVIGKWLVPSTANKLKKRQSPSGRIMQGRKGIGRYAASILGDDLQLETVDKEGVKTTLYVKWSEFSNYEYLDQIDIPVQTEHIKQAPGTILTMHSDISENEYWNDETLKLLRFELKRLIPPKADSTFDDNFKIWLCFDNFFEDDTKNIREEITPYPILDLFDYRISGTISPDGKGVLTYENQKIKNGVIESISFDCGFTACGPLTIDVRVYDREGEAIDQLIQRGLKDDSSNQYVTRLQARQLLNSVNGIGVYRNGFRIRPLGDADFDWLKLNEQRVQNPSMKIGNNQVAGYVHVESEEISGLEEKSARDGLKNNYAYKQLVKITCEIINELEQRRYIFRRKLGLSKPGKKIERQLEELYDYSTLKTSVSSSLKKAGLSETVISEVTDIITKEEIKKNETIEDIKKTVAVYQGQATLGKIVNIILHEGRRPLNYFKNQIPNLHFYGNRFEQNKDQGSVAEIIKLTTGITDNASVFVGLFGRLDPLSAKRRETKSEFSLAEALNGVASVFESECIKEKIIIDVQCPEDIKLCGWKQDIYTIFANLFDNSIFWIVEKKCLERKIIITAIKSGKELVIDYIDSGPGINNDLLESGVIFEPQFTTKPNGTGLGLSIAGEAAIRNGLTLTAVQDEKGAHFKVSAE
ncbi:sensor histidine kinase [Clostridium sp. BNL1100]|uniref:sensor histidine kinase n=1 Tax=Clostridium sp. BNL1100 TaxID=755731 RepID=UPI00024A7D30|nr:sensor histidine kinase [Clostridium sp. BNL1100]AEY67529.1 signal transduction histidine kinase [Clostridium sp. BNL1100]